MNRRLLVPLLVALVAACSGGGNSISWGDREGIWAACYFVDKGRCMDFLAPMDDTLVGEIKQGCQKEDGLWSEFTCPETQLGSCEIVAAKEIIRYYRAADLEKGKFACGYVGDWSQP